MEELEIGDYINDINSYHLHMFDKHDVTTKKLDVIVEKAGKVDANYAAQIEGYCSLLGEYGKKFEAVCAMLALDLIGVKVFKYSDETAEAVASGEKLLKESQTVYESFADMMSPDDAAKYLDFLENGSKEGLTSAELAGVEKADALLVSQKVGYEDVWDLRNAGDMLESGTTTLQTGGRQIDYNAYIKRLETIDMEYENIRIDTTDISKIAQNTGMPEWKISRIKDHVFSNEHILDAGVKRFDADPEIADAWYRLTNGTYNQNDIDLLNHEYFESKFESFYKTDYRTAHNKTEESGRIWDPYKENN